jgi:hypothetical protein
MRSRRRRGRRVTSWVLVKSMRWSNGRRNGRVADLPHLRRARRWWPPSAPPMSPPPRKRVGCATGSLTALRNACAMPTPLLVGCISSDTSVRHKRYIIGGVGHSQGGIFWRHGTIRSRLTCTSTRISGARANAARPASTRDPITCRQRLALGDLHIERVSTCLDLVGRIRRPCGSAPAAPPPFTSCVVWGRPLVCRSHIIYDR